MGIRSNNSATPPAAPGPTPDGLGHIVSGARLKQLRRSRDLSQRALAEACHVSQQTISRLEQNPGAANTNTLVAVANYFGVPAGYLLGEEILDVTGEFACPAEVLAALKPFLVAVLGTGGDAPKLLADLTASLRSGASTIAARTTTMADEEEILGRWTSLSFAYLNAEWRSILAHAMTITHIATRIGRPHLAAIGHAYAADALRNSGKPDGLNRAKRHLKDIPPDADSIIVHRLIADIHHCDKKYSEAISSYDKANQLVKQQPASRRDFLYALEKVRLHRGLADSHMHLAEASYKQQPRVRMSHLECAEEHCDHADRALKTLRRHCPRPAQAEDMLLGFAKAKLYALLGQHSVAIVAARYFLATAEEIGAASRAAEIKMFLVDWYMESDEPEQAASLYAQLLPQCHSFTPALEEIYNDRVWRHEVALRSWFESESSKHRSGMHPPSL